MWPNIIGNFEIKFRHEYWVNSSGALSLSNGTNGGLGDFPTSLSKIVSFNASKSNSIYSSSTVQPKSLTTIYIIKS